jgi:N-acetylmuramoyl-L-alanine amidase
VDVYSERDRVSTKRIVITLGGIALGVVAALVAGNAILGAVLGPAPTLESKSQELTFSAETTQAQEITPAVVATPVAEVAPVVPVVPKPAPVKPKSAPKAVKPVTATVVIDAGHQKKGDSSLEPVGPGASEKKAKVAGGARGVSTGNPEGAITLEIAKRLRDELEVRGVKVIMVRTKQDVNIANSKRAKIANDARADLFIRLHGDGASSSSARGLSTLIPGKNEWTGPILSESKKAGTLIHEAVIASTGASDRGLKKRSDLSGFNWSKVPTVLVEMGFMSNPAEDRKLASSEYQTKLAKGMAAGIMKYLESK